jgi:hypothetical protein
MQMIIEYTRKLKYKRKIVLVTNGTGMMSDDGIEGIVEKMKEDNIELVVMYVSRQGDFALMLIGYPAELISMTLSMVSKKKRKIAKRYLIVIESTR